MFSKRSFVKKEKLAEKKTPFLALALAMCLTYTACGSPNGETVNESPQQTREVSIITPVENMKIRIKVGDRILTATLVESKAARDFVSQLPLTLTLEDYARTEKISVLPKRLSTEGSPSGSDPSVGDIAYYAPWGNMAIYYKDSGYASGLIILGEIDGDAGAFNIPGSVKVTMESVRQRYE